jgi:hypothetical protein
MSLRATVEPVMRDYVAPDAAAVDVTMVNEGREPERFHDYQARHGSLVLQVEDENGSRVLLAPPPPPDERDLGPARQLAPGESVTLRYTGFLDTRRETGRYRVRFFSPHREFGGSTESPLASEWVVLDLGRPQAPPLSLLGLLSRVVYEVAQAVVLWWNYYIYRVPARYFCGAVLEQEVDVPITERITDGVPGSWSNTFSWNARFHVQVDQPGTRIVVTIRLRLAGVDNATAMAWAATVADKWADRCKVCVVPRCSSDGFPIQVAVLFVQSGEHYTVTLAPQGTVNLLNWGPSDTGQGHEVGHMLGNKDEYFTVDGVPFGGLQPSGNIMNNQRNHPLSQHYWLIERTVASLLGMNDPFPDRTVKERGAPCS